MQSCRVSHYLQFVYDLKICRKKEITQFMLVANWLKSCKHNSNISGAVSTGGDGAILTGGDGAVLTSGDGAVLTWGRFDCTPYLSLLLLSSKVSELLLPIQTMF